jgi:4-amino-4-deoxy-L-arabinose transferase-like glycosyltransferase
LKSAIRNYALLFVGCVLFHIAGTWSLPLIDRDEPRFAESSREMIQRGDYVVPYFNNQLRLDKPPLTYWAQAASYCLFGQNDFAARFPSAIAAAFTALSLLGWGSRLSAATPPHTQTLEIRTGWWAAIIFTLSLQVFLHAKAAVADTWLVLFMTLAYWAGYERLRIALRNAERHTPNIESRTSLWWWIFYLSLALAFLAKGPIGWVPLLTIGSTIFYARHLQLGRRFKFVRGILLMLAIVALWGVPALIRTHGQFFVIGIGRHVIARSFTTMEGHGANSFGLYLLLLPFYFITVFVSFFPWSIKLPQMVKELRNRRDDIDNYLIAGVAVIFIIFTLLKTKLPHYTLPAFPLLALLLARGSTAENSTRFFRTCTVASVSVYLAIALAVSPLLARLFPAYQLFEQSRTYLRPNMQFASVEFEEPSLVWYFRSRVSGFLTPMGGRRAANFMQEMGPRFVILPTSMATTLFASHPENWKTFSTTGFDIAKGNRVELTLVLNPE